MSLRARQKSLERTDVAATAALAGRISELEAVREGGDPTLSLARTASLPTSRAGATILFAMAIGLTRAAATEFSFLLGIPTMFAASAYAIYKDLKAPSPDEHTAWSMVALGTLVSAVVAFIVVRWLLRFSQSHTFVGFGWYRIALGLLMVAFALR